MPSERLQAVIDSIHEDSRRSHHARFKGLALTSHFQPIYSLSHSRVIGHEGLLRARTAHGVPVSPLEVFASCLDEQESSWCDSLSRGVHLKNFVAQQQADQWLFLNIRPEAVLSLSEAEGGRYLTEVCARLSIPTSHIVLELLESAIPQGPDFLDAMAKVRRLGFLVALDDFGAGHSNFDRVWSIKPDIVKLDRSLVAGLAQDRSRQRVVAQMVSLLHECGSLVLMEGVETQDEALVALESDVDFVQGYYFGRPQPEVLTSERSSRIVELHGQLAQWRQAQHRHQKELVAPYQNAIGYTGVLLSTARDPQEACRAFLALPHAEVCFVLDENGYQVGTNLWAEPYRDVRERAYGPLVQTEGACWARRPYFKRALQSPGRVQVTRPYRTLNGDRLSITASVAFLCKVDGREVWRVICGDVVWDDRGEGLMGDYAGRTDAARPGAARQPAEAPRLCVGTPREAAPVEPITMATMSRPPVAVLR